MKLLTQKLQKLGPSRSSSLSSFPNSLFKTHTKGAWKSTMKASNASIVPTRSKNTLNRKGNMPITTHAMVMNTSIDDNENWIRALRVSDQLGQERLIVMDIDRGRVRHGSLVRLRFTTPQSEFPKSAIDLVAHHLGFFCLGQFIGLIFVLLSELLNFLFEIVAVVFGERLCPFRPGRRACCRRGGRCG